MHWETKKKKIHVTSSTAISILLWGSGTEHVTAPRNACILPNAEQQDLYERRKEIYSVFIQKSNIQNLCDQ